MQKQRLARVSASLFGIVLGLAGLGNSWRVAHRIWGLPAYVGEGILLLAGIVWLTLVLLFALKWLLARDAAVAELNDPVQSTYIALIGIASNLVAIGLYPYTHAGALWLFVFASFLSITYGVFFTSSAWSGNRHSGDNTGSLYLPTVAGCFVMGTAAATMGYSGFAQLALGAGGFSWLSIESVILHRLYAHDQMPAVQRPSLGIQFAPAAVAAVTYLAINGGVADVFSRALLGYAILQGLVLIRLFRWIAEHPLSVSYWAFTFGSASLATSACRMVEHGEQGVVKTLAPILFAGANLVIGSMSAITLGLWTKSLLSSPRRRRRVCHFG